MDGMTLDEQQLEEFWQTCSDIEDEVESECEDYNEEIMSDEEFDSDEDADIIW